MDTIKEFISQISLNKYYDKRNNSKINKKVYIGTWLNGKMHGFGKLLHKNKKTIYGYWDSGNLVLNYNTLDSVIKENEFLKKQKTLLNLVSIDDITIYNLYKLKNKSV